VLLPKIKKIPKNTNGRLAIPALAGLLVSDCAGYAGLRFSCGFDPPGTGQLTGLQTVQNFPLLLSKRCRENSKTN